MTAVNPDEHDEHLLALEDEQRKAEKSASRAERIYRIKHLGQRRRGGEWTYADGSPATLPLDDSQASSELIAAMESVQSVRQRIVEHERSYTGWSRYRLVISSGDGHIHGRSDCRTFRSTTKTVVIPSLSGRPVEDAVSMLGNVCCSVCLSTNVQSPSNVPSSLVNVLIRRGTKAFEQAVEKKRSVHRSGSVTQSRDVEETDVLR